MDKFGAFSWASPTAASPAPASPDRLTTTYTAKATIARQSGGKRLLAQYGSEPCGAEPTQGPKAERGPDDSGCACTLAWNEAGQRGRGRHELQDLPRRDERREVLLNSAGREDTFDDLNATRDGLLLPDHAVNSVGEGAFCNEVVRSHHRSAGPDPCTVPGVTVSTTPRIPAESLPPTAVDIKSVSIAEPYSGGADIWPSRCRSARRLLLRRHAVVPSSERPVPSGSADRTMSGKDFRCGSRQLRVRNGLSAKPESPDTLGSGRRTEATIPATGPSGRDRQRSRRGVAAGQNADGREPPELFPGPMDFRSRRRPHRTSRRRGQYTCVGNESCRPNAAARFDVVTIARRGGACR